MSSRWDKHNAMVDDQKWSAAIAYTRAYNDWKAALALYGDAFDEAVQAKWRALLLAEREYKRMAKK